MGSEKIIRSSRFEKTLQNGFLTLKYDKVAGNQILDSKTAIFLCDGPMEQISQDQSGLANASIRGQDFLNHYQKNGMKALSIVDGAFSFFLYEPSYQRLLICGDDYHTRPIYYAGVGQELLFSNDLADLVRCLKEKSISKAALMEYLRFLDISPPYTIYENVFTLAPENILLWEKGKLSLPEKTEPDLAIDLAGLSDDEIVDAFDKMLNQLIALKLENQGSAGAFLSGGIDSSLIAAIASSQKSDLGLYTVGFANTQYDESGIASKIAQSLGTQHEVFVYSGQQDMETFDLFVSNVPSPFADPAIIPTFQCFKEISGVKQILLDGTGADTGIGIKVPRHIEFIFKHSRFYNKKMRSLAAKMLSFSGRTAGYKTLFDFNDELDFLIRWDGWKKDEISRLTHIPCSLDHTMFYQLYRQIYTQNSTDIYSTLTRALPDDRLHFCARHFGQDIGFPFNKNMAAFIKAVPRRLRYTDSENKVLYRRVLYRYLPQELWDSPVTHGFNFPFTDFLKRNNFEAIDLFLSQSRIQQQELFDESMVKTVVSEFKKGNDSLNFKVWGLVTFQAWYDRFYSQL